MKKKVAHFITALCFDNGGVLWDGRGAYNLWMDPKSKKAFDDMADCIIQEYNGTDFCMDENHCVDGYGTQGENIADNGGLRVAYRAYQAYVGLHGEDPRLPGEITSQFTNDQLFFIGFTRTWCDQADKPANKFNWHEAHSPGPLRIFGTLQNFDQFRAAFNCPIGSRYAPESVCKVWIEEVYPNLGIPTVPTILPQINIPLPEIANNNAAYNEVVTYFSQTIDIKQNPCSNFYEYACNKIKSRPPNTQQINLDVAKNMVNAIPALDKTKIYNQPVIDYYTQCVATLSNAPDPIIINHFINETFRVANVPFPLFDNRPAPDFTDNQLALAIGYLAGTQAINTLIDAKVVKNFNTTLAVDQKYIFYIGEPVLTQPVEFYKEPSRAVMVKGIKKAFFDVLNVTRTLLNKLDITDNQLNDTVESFYNIETALAANTRSVTDKNDAKKAETFYSIAELKTDFAFLDWDEFFGQISTNGPETVASKFNNDEYKISVAAKDNLANVIAAIRPPSGITADMFANYLHFRVVWDLATSLFEVQDNGYGDLPIIGDKDKLRQYICALETRDLGYVHSNVYITNSIGQANIESLRGNVTKLGNRIVGALKSQIQQTNWLSTTSKSIAGAKLDNLTLNVLVDNKAFDETFLDQFYVNYHHPEPPSPSTVLEAARKFSLFNSLALLNDSVTEVDRDEFFGSSSNPWPTYDPLTNSLSIPAAIAVKPLFDPSHPLASNYGGLGYLIAHSLAHSFDKFGIEFDEYGNLKDILDTDSFSNFTEMSTCLITQYNSFCPLQEGDYTPNCLDGNKTLNENVADNAGIHAAYTSYLSAKNFQGSDPRLNSPIFGQFTEDQLFFLSYARDFCSLPQNPGQIYANIISGGDNPPNFRILASLRNYPAFKSAFNCPVTSNYTLNANEICNVWISDSSNIAQQ